MHPLAVSEIVRNQGYGMDYQITALFHDLLEDTDATEEEIFDLGGARVLEAVRLLTKQEGYVMAEYVAGAVSYTHLDGYKRQKLKSRLVF